MQVKSSTTFPNYFLLDLDRYKIEKKQQRNFSSQTNRQAKQG